MNIPNKRAISSSSGPLPYVFIGDAAFPLMENMMRPYPGLNLINEQHIFNYRLSRARRMIENCFGILVIRWRVLYKKMVMKPKNAQNVILACVILHNFLRSKNETKR